MSAGGRPPAAGHPAFAARDRHTGRVLSWADGVWAGDQDAVEQAEAMIWAGEPVEVGPHGPTVDPVQGDPIAALAIMRAVLGGNLALTGNPPSLPPSSRR